MQNFQDLQELDDEEELSDFLVISTGAGSAEIGAAADFTTDKRRPILSIVFFLFFHYRFFIVTHVHRFLILHFL